MKTHAEIVFEDFCNSNRILWEKIKEDTAPTPDYRVFFDGYVVYVEVKQIDKDNSFSTAEGSRTVGSHIREKIKAARRQVKVGSRTGFPSILLIYNNLDPNQMFGSETHDFITAMYGEITYVFNTEENRLTESFYGRNRSFGKGKSDYFSAIGFLSDIGKAIRVQVYQNVFDTQNPLDFSKLPSCIEVIRVELE
jgi:hypothetical protein